VNLDAYGSTLDQGPLFSVLRARGPIFSPSYHRQILANKAGARFYVDAHLNAGPPASNYGFCILSRSDVFTERLARALARKMSEHLDVRPAGSLIRAKGWGNIGQVTCPAILWEPAFITHRPLQRVISTGEGIEAIGRILAETIREFFPTGGVIALSNSHADRGTRDPGALVPAEFAPDPAFDTEAEFVEEYLTLAAERLLSYRLEAA